MIYRVYNHNHRLLGEFKTQREAQREASYYMEQQVTLLLYQRRPHHELLRL